MNTADSQQIIDYYALYGVDRGQKAKEIVKSIRIEQAKARDHMQALQGKNQDYFLKAQQIYNMASEALKRFKTEARKKEYDQELDAAYQAGMINTEQQKMAENLIEEIQNLFVNGNYQGVVNRCSDALTRKLYDERIYSLMAQSYSFMDNQSQAMDSIDKGLEMYPESIEILSTGARLYNVEQRNYDQAQKLINRMFEVAPDNKWANIEQIYLYLMFDKEDLGYQNIDEYLRKYPQDQEFRSACAHDLVSYSYKFHTKDPETGVYVIISEEAYNKCVEISDKAVSIWKDEITLDAQESIRRFGEKEFNRDNLEDIVWSGIAAGFYFLCGIMTIGTIPGGFIIAVIPLAIGALMAYCTYQLYQVSNRPYWQIMKYYLTGKREKKEKKYILIGKLLSFYMRWSVKAAFWIVKFIFRRL